MRLMQCTVRLTVCLLVAAGLVAPSALAQSGDNSSTKTSYRKAHASDRLFLGFAEEASLVDRQWWEGQLEFQDGDLADATILRGVAAFQPWDDFEVGGKVGFGDTDANGLTPDGSGATDLDLWGKFHFGNRDGNEYAAGVTLIVPTGDDTAGLGLDAFSAGGFLSMRRQMKGWTFNGNVGLAFNDDGQVFGMGLDGETSFTVGAAGLIPIGDRTTFVGEARYQSERFDGFDSDTRILGGLNFHVTDGGLFRVALGLGLSDGAPDAQLIAGYASTF